MSAINSFIANAPLHTERPTMAAQPLGVITELPGSSASRTSTGYDAAPVATSAAAITPAVTHLVGTKFGAQTGAEFATAAGGGPISDLVSNGVARIAAFAQSGMRKIEEAIQGDMAVGGGQVDPGKLQQYSMQMSNFEMMNQLAAKIQDKQEAAIRAWLR